MSLHSFSFLLFFAAIVAVMTALQLARIKLPAAGALQLWFLLLCSYFFLLKTDWRFCACIAVVTLLTYGLGRRIEKTRSARLLIGGITALLLFLAYFKYTNFFVNNLRTLLGLDSVTLHIILPLGVSFYIFSALAYLIDVYRGDYPAEKNLMRVAPYIAFFPKLTAGPIVRGRSFFPQVKAYRGIRWDAFKAGIQIFVFGLFKKIVLADHLGVFVDDVFRAPTAFNTGTVVLAAISYSLQIYLDFSGYSDMAIGASKILGFDFEPNFNLPYLSQNVSEFWKRWHISLSSWFRDYLYIPLGGSRKGTARTYLNLMVVMLVSGLWHGAGWTFLAWGALHGIACCAGKAAGKYLKVLGPYGNGIITFVFVTLFWVVFRADNIDTAVQAWTGVFTAHGGISQPYTWSFFAMACVAAATVFAWLHGRKMNHTEKAGINGYYPVLDLSKFWSLAAFFTFCGLTILMGYFGNTAFIYGAF
jgi:alginate O-acetyltransferase complex protein AlgI